MVVIIDMYCSVVSFYKWCDFWISISESVFLFQTYISGVVSYAYVRKVIVNFLLLDMDIRNQRVLDENIHRQT